MSVIIDDKYYGVTKEIVPPVITTIEIKDIEALNIEVSETLSGGVRYNPKDQLAMANQRIENLEHRLTMVNAQLRKWLDGKSN